MENDKTSALLFQLSHDIRTGINSIIGFAGNARKNIYNTGRLEESLEKVENSSMQLLDTVNNVLDLIRIGNGSFQLEEEKANVEDFAVELEEKWRDDMMKNSQLLVTNIQTLINRVVTMDTQNVGRAVEIIFNYMRGLAGPGSEIHFNLREDAYESDDKGMYHFIISVPKLKLDPSELKNTFDAFYGELYLESRLPLVIAKNIFGMYGGDVGITSSDVSGTVADISLPLKPTSAFVAFKSKYGTEHTKETLRGRRVLVVEDNELNREIMVDMVVEYGMLFEEAEDGEQAVEKVLGNPPDYFNYVLMDVAMPKMNGYEATKKIRQKEEYANLPIIAITANVSTGDKDEALEAGMNAYVPKPVNMDKLINTMLYTDDALITNRRRVQ